jgi:hypothetical protein
MKKLILAAFLLLWELPANAAIANVQHTPKDAGTVTTTNLAYGSSPALNNLLLVVVRAGGTTALPFSVSDTIGNTWTGLTSHAVATIGETQLFWAVNKTAAADTVTASISGAAATLRIAIYEYSGTATSSPVDVENNSATATSTTAAAVSITPAANNELIIAFEANAANHTLTAGTNFLMEDVVPAAPNTKLGVQDWIQTTATATTGPISIDSGGDTWMAGIAAFKPSGGAVAPTGMNKRQKYEQLDP